MCGGVRAARGCAEPDLSGRCRAVHGQPSPRSTSVVVLTTAHLDDNPGSAEPLAWDGPEMRVLVAMCQRCHLAYDSRVHTASRAASGRGDVPPLFEVAVHR